ncbi:FKBP-type peptidyl-prolyl cis-trans isomerase [Mycoplasma sp. P36-A1]|uniref:FKBP-type peptidyl-prolyl cis-trans isomerase n=1 Tax=Mycoplasma sp. P36-A1 TaxID=3252900 RepID=UPI003C2F879C
MDNKEIDNINDNETNIKSEEVIDNDNIEIIEDAEVVVEDSTKDLKNDNNDESIDAEIIDAEIVEDDDKVIDASEISNDEDQLEDDVIDTTIIDEKDVNEDNESVVQDVYIEKNNEEIKVEDVEKTINDNNLIIDENVNNENENELVDERKDEVVLKEKKKLTKGKILQYVLMSLGGIFIVLIAAAFALNQYDKHQMGVEADKLVHNLRVQSATEQKNGNIEKGDVVLIDYDGKIDNVAFDGGSAEGARLEIGSNSFIDNFEDQLVNHKKGETVEVKVNFPADYASTELQGKEAVFTVKIKDVYKLPELNDKFVASLGIEGVSTPTQLRDYAKSYIEYYQQMMSQGSTTTE